MFTSFARRLTLWYVAAAVALVMLLLAACAILVLAVYVHAVQDGVDTDAREAQALADRAAARHEPFIALATEIEQRLSLHGIRMVAVARPTPPRRLGREPMSASRGTPPLAVVNGKVTRTDPRLIRFDSNRFGLALATAFGARLQHVDLGDGDLRIFPDPEATQRMALWLLGGILLFGVSAGVLSWFIGRYITLQVLRPLIDVTYALQRFATRDFTPQPIAVGGKSEFDTIALAYNAAAAQVASAFAERQQAESQMRQFVADAGHELRTPLTIVFGYFDLLRRKADANDERSRRIFTSIGQEGARIRTLIDNLVLLARMEGADVRPSEPFELRPLLEQIVEARRVLHPGLRLDLECSVDAAIIGNEAEIHEAIANVLDNAIKYAPDTAIGIRSTSGDRGVDVIVSDAGPGIHPDEREAIFGRFYRGVTRGDVEGSGLGLAIARRAVERASGTLTLAQTSPTGTTFTFELRADRVREPERYPA